MKQPNRLLIVTGLVVCVTSLAAAFQLRRVDADLNSAAESSEWLMVGHDYGEHRHSPLTQITVSNVARLGQAWSYDIGPGEGPKGTPLFANGVLYGISTWSVTFAVDARTGKELWHYDPKADRSTRLCCGVISRGVALYEGKLIVPVIDGRVQALDAATGTLLWSARVVPERKPGEAFPYSVTMAPRVVKGKVFIGNAGAEFTPYRGYVSALDVNTGKELWRFYTVPGDPSKPFENEAMALAAKTWAGEWWKMGGGGSIWDGMAFDPDTNLVYVGTGNGLPYPQELRHGGQGPARMDNLYVASILALSADTGALKWHYQCTPGDQWDYDAVQHLQLADLRINGRDRKVVMQANKNGFFYVLDRVTGEFISGEPMAPVNWARGLDPRTGRPLINDDAYYTSTRAVTVQPYQTHAASQMSFNPATGLVYVPIVARGSLTYLAEERFTPSPTGQDRGTLAGPKVAESAPSVATPPAYGPVRTTTQSGILSAWDPVTQKERWFAVGGGPFGGVMSTAANLVFQTLSGGRLLAYRADTGERLLDLPTGLTGAGPPITYQVDGRQFVAFIGGGINTNAQLSVYAVDAAR
ncbi:MAG TPA: PQQ-dependent dehydrogenase, methanol/ethanol family [Vicinamibacterales bacterium]|nr:PQQ-dependent dehydrogenase, methanol/ethanol family [Vicinamibacterales bacterium]